MVRVDDRPAMNAAKTRPVQFSLKSFERVIAEVPLRRRDDVHQLGFGLERYDLGGIEQIQIRTAPSDDFAQSVGAGFARLGLELSLRLFDCFFEALPADRLQQVVYRAHLERLDRKSVVEGKRVALRGRRVIK